MHEPLSFSTMQRGLSENSRENTENSPPSERMQLFGGATDSTPPPGTEDPQIENLLSLFAQHSPQVLKKESLQPKKPLDSDSVKKDWVEKWGKKFLGHSVFI